MQGFPNGVKRWGDYKFCLGGDRFYWMGGGGITLGIILIFQSFCDAQLNIPYILKISLLKLVSDPTLA